MTVGEVLAASGLAPSEARLLLSAASGLSRATLAAHPEAPLDDVVTGTFRALTSRRARGEPIAYLLGKREFYGVTLKVSPDVLIPRPETELLVDFSIERIPKHGSLLDLGTGSGAIALAIRQQRPDARVTAVEQSAASLRVARENAGHHQLQVEFLAGDWFEPVPGRRFDVIVANPPYVAETDPHLGQGDLRFEPRAALVGGADGLDAIRLIVRRANSHLVANGWIAIEHGMGQDAEVRRLLLEAGLESVASQPDLAGIARISVGKYNPD